MKPLGHMTPGVGVRRSKLGLHAKFETFWSSGVAMNHWLVVSFFKSCSHCTWTCPRAPSSTKQDLRSNSLIRASPLEDEDASEELPPSLPIEQVLISQLNSIFFPRSIGSTWRIFESFNLNERFFPRQQWDRKRTDTKIEKASQKAAFFIEQSGHF